MRTPAAAPGRFGVSFAAGVLSFAAMSLILLGIVEDVAGHGCQGLWTVADAPVATWLGAHRSPWLTSAMRLATWFGSPWAVTGLAAALALYVLWRRHLRWLAVLLVTVPGGTLFNRLLKAAVRRGRPYLDDPVVTVTGYSFPSGHTLAATVLYGVVAAYLCAHTRDWRLRALTLVSASLLVAAVGASRVYLGAHYVSDVLGSLAEGLAWLSLSLTAAHAIRRRRPRLR
jgi:membrane-associated phospholipid phosphatase